MKEVFMTEIFPDPIRNLPEADIPFEGIKAYLSQANTHHKICKANCSSVGRE